MSVRRYGLVGVALATVAALVSGCGGTGKSVTVDDFTAGSCRQIAPAVIKIAHLVSVAHKHHGVDEQAQQEFTAAQAVIRDQPAKPAASQDLVTAIGFLRLRLDSHTYAPQLLTDVKTAQQQLERMCTAG
jgi:LAS superfamily LD-carboxypeptidase LdcB